MAGQQTVQVPGRETPLFVAETSGEKQRNFDLIDD